MRVLGRRFKVWRTMVAVAIVALIFVITSRMFDVLWVGHASLPLEFLALDASTGRPIGGALIRLIDGPPEYEATTGPDGKAKIVIEARAAGSASLFHRTRSVYYLLWRLVISAKGYKSVKDDLNQYTWDPRFHSDPIPPPLVIRLQPDPSNP
jgi:hypothetical protein